MFHRPHFNSGKLALAILAVFSLASSAAALYIRLTLDHTDSITQVFAVTSEGTYKHDGLAPSDGSTYTQVGYGFGQAVDEFQVLNGACITHNAHMWVRTDWYLELTATVDAGTAVACVRSSEFISCCPPNGQDNQEE